MEDREPKSQPAEVKSNIEKLSYPTETILKSIELVDLIVNHKGTAVPSTSSEISVITGRSESNLTMKLSSASQYGILKNMKGKGYITTKLYDEYKHPIYSQDPKKKMMEMFQNAPLYAKIIEDYNGKTLPAEIGFTNLLKTHYNLNPNSAERACKVFFENSKNLQLIDGNQKFRFLMPQFDQQNIEVTTTNSETPSIENNTTQNKETAKNNNYDADDMIEIPIRFKNRKTSYLTFPQDFTDEELEKLVKVITVHVNAYKEKFDINSIN